MTRKSIFRGALLVGATIGFASSAHADFVINDDLIVDGSACVGFDCVNGESFGFDTIRLKENNLRIKFDDTSSTASFPSTDWQITINDSANGGQAKFSIDDISGSRTPFTIEANARTHSLYVDDGGRIGNGTSTPVVDIHTVDGDTPTLRLQQDGSSGFAPQTWDVAGNEANFFIRDVSNGSQLPFRIRPGAPSSSIDIASNGDVGIGTISPDAKLDVDGGSDSAIMMLSQNGAVPTQWEFKNNAGSGRLTIGLKDGNDPFKVDDGADSNLLRVGWPAANGVEVNGDLEVSGDVAIAGSCTSGCDRVFHDDYELLGIQEHAAIMWEKKHLPNVGPTPENGPFKLAQKIGGILNELEHAHIYIEQLHTRLEQQKLDFDARLAELEAKTQ